jgi:ADP-ribosylglycohydrolase
MEYVSDVERAIAMSQEPAGLARNELQQAAESGHDVAHLRARLAALSPRDDEALMDLYQEVLALPQATDWPYVEPSALPEILATLPDAASSTPVDRLPDRILGAWTGRIVGCMMGKPFEVGPTRASIRAYLETKHAYPLTGYVPFDNPAERSQLGISGFEGLTEGRVHGSVRDDDVDYTVLGLHLLEAYGSGYTARDVAGQWLARFPIYQVFTAERATYRNLLRDVPLAEAGEYENPYREWIGALIRADIFGYVAAGAPRRAAVLSYQDACLSHRANGIYGEMWAAALIASAFTVTSPEAAIVESLRHVPPASRLAEEIRTVLQQFQAGMDWEACLDALYARHAGMSWVHTINNAGALAAALLWGEGRFAETAGLAVQAGLDTDSIGATAGSWVGAFLGQSRLPAALVDPLEDRCRSGVFGFGELSINALAERTLALAEPGAGANPA